MIPPHLTAGRHLAVSEFAPSGIVGSPGATGDETLNDSEVWFETSPESAEAGCQASRGGW